MSVPQRKPRVVTTVSGVPREVYDRMNRKRRGALIEPIYLFVGMALSVEVGSLVLVSLDSDTLTYWVHGVVAGLLTLALILLLVEVRRG
jgi:hypothetical protein